MGLLRSIVVVVIALCAGVQAFEVLTHYEVLTGDCIGALQCRAGLTIGKQNNVTLVVAGYIIRQVSSPVPASEFTQISQLSSSSAWTSYRVTARRLLFVYRNDRSRTQCSIDIDLLAQATFVSLLEISKSCISENHPSCEQYRVLSTCNEITLASVSSVPTASPSVSTTPL